MNRRLRNLLLILVAGAAGLWAAAWHGPGLVLEARSVASWPSVTGEVASSHSERRDGGKNSSDTWVVVVAYRYEVDGFLHHGDRWTVAGPRKARDEAHARELRDGYFEGDPIEVRYDPDDPGRAVIEEGGTLHGWLTIGFGLLLLGLAAHVARRALLRP